MQSIIAAYRHGIQKACEVLDLSRDTIHRWMRDYKEHGTAGLENSNKPSRSILTDQQKVKIKEWLAEEPTCTLKILVHKCSKEFGINIGKSSIHRFIKAAGYSHIIGRKKHYKTDIVEQELFKKNLKIR